MQQKLTKDILSENGWEKRFINDANNVHTRRARLGDMLAFVHTLRDEDSHGKPRCESPTYYLIHQPPEYARKVMMDYRKQLVRQKLSPSTINRRLATVRAWVRYAQKVMLTRLSPDDLVGELTVDTEQRTRAIDSMTLARVCAQPDVSMIRGLRDAALLHLICEVPLVGWQLCSLRVRDVRGGSGQLQIPIVNTKSNLGEDGNVRDKSLSERRVVPVKVSPETLERIHAYLSQNQLQHKAESPLFINFDRRPNYAGMELVPKSILHLVKEYGNQADIPNLNPRSVRISAIINTLEIANWKATIAHRRFPHVGLHTWFHYARDR
jgi:integrase/recombinase XerC